MINYSLQSNLEVPCFIAGNNNEKLSEMLGVNAMTKEVNNNFRHKIKSFEMNNLSESRCVLYKSLIPLSGTQLAGPTQV